MALNYHEIRDIFMQKYPYGKFGLQWPRKSIVIVKVDLVGHGHGEGKSNIYRGRFDSDTIPNRDTEMLYALKVSVSQMHGQIEEMKKNMDVQFRCQFIMNYSPRADFANLLIGNLPKIFGEQVEVEIFFSTFYKCHPYEYSPHVYIAKNNLAGLRELHKRFKLGLLDNQKKWRNLVLQGQDLSDYERDSLLRFATEFGRRDQTDRIFLKETITDVCDVVSGGIDKELKILGPDVESFYHKACLEGSKSVHRMRLMIVGHFAAGKTSLKNSLRDLPFCPEHNTTNGIDADPLVCKVDVEDFCNWKPITSEQEKEEHSLGVAQTIHRMQTRQSDDSLPSLIKHESVSQPDDRREEMDAATAQVPDSLDGASGTHPTMMDTSEGDPSLVIRMKPEGGAPQRQIVPDETKLTEVKRHYEKLDSEPAETKQSDPRLSIWDFGGQTEFYETHSIFLGHRSIYLVVLNLAKCLTEIIPTDRQGRHRKVPNKTCPQSAADYLEYWLNSIYTHVGQRRDSKQKPAVLIVGTHKDKLLKDGRQEDISQYYTAIHKLIERKAFSEMVHQTFFAIANNDNTDDGVQKLKKCIVDVAQEQPYWDEQIPLKWIDLREKLMQRKADEVMDLDTGYEIAKQAGIESKEDFRKVLRFYHQLGDVVFFDEDNLRSLIVLNPQWLINAFSQVLTIRKAHSQREFPGSREHWRNLEENGLLHDEVLEYVWDSSKKDHLLNLMQRFGLILPMRLCNLAQVYQEAKDPDRLYIVPSFLPPLEHENNKNRPSAIVIAFKGGFVPTGVTSAMITSLVTEQKWALHGKIHHNHAIFLPAEGEDSDFSISIQEKPGILELRRKVLCTPKVLPDACLEPYVQVVLKQLQSVMRTRNCKTEFELAVWCSCKGSKESTLRKIGPTGEAIKGLKALKCHSHSGAFLAARYANWFHVDSAHKNQRGPTNHEEVSDKLLQGVASRIPKWHELGIRLVGYPKVEELTTPIQGGPALHGLKVLMKWYCAQGDISIPAMKQHLASVLRDHARGDLAQVVENHHELNPESLFNDISPELVGVGLWKEVGISLGLADKDLQEISAVQMAESNPALEMLRRWRSKTKGKQKTKLINALRKEKRRDVSRFVEQWREPQPSSNRSKDSP